MDHAVEFVKAKTSGQITKNILHTIKKSISVLQIHSNEGFLNDVAEILMGKNLKFDENDWSEARNIAVSLMAHNIAWVQVTFYKDLAFMVKTAVMGEEENQSEREMSLNVLHDVSILTEICCHGLSSSKKEVCANENNYYIVNRNM